EEECCDALVVGTLPGQVPAYAAVLVETAAFLSGRAVALPAGASGAAPVRHLKRRLQMILNRSSRRSLPRPALLALGMAALLLLPTLPTFGDNKPEGVPMPREAASVDRLIATEAGCRSCHQVTAAHSAAPGHLHDEITKLVAEREALK